MVNWGVIGCGGIADRRTIPGLLEAKNARLLAVMDQVPEVTKRCKRSMAARAAMTQADPLADREIDAVHIASPFSHTKQVMRPRGKHILRRSLWR